MGDRRHVAQVCAARPHDAVRRRVVAAGDFYASTGPGIEEVRIEGGTVEVVSSPCRSLTLVSARSTGAAVHAGRLGYRHKTRILACDPDGLVVRAAIKVPPAAKHVRVEVADAAGRRAWANPIPV